MCLLVLYFSPDHLRDPTNFAAVANKLICSPVTQVLVFTKVRLTISRCLAHAPVWGRSASPPCAALRMRLCWVVHGWMAGCCCLGFRPPAARQSNLWDVASGGRLSSAVACAAVQIPRATREWIDKIIAWDFRRVVTAHFNAPVDATPADVRSVPQTIQPPLNSQVITFACCGLLPATQPLASLQGKAW